MANVISEGLCFDDVLLVPQYSEIESRSKIDLSVKMGDLIFKHPLIPANMATVTGQEMVWEVIRSGGLAILHRFMPIQEQFDIAEDAIEEGWGKHFAVSLGVQPNDLDNFTRFYDLGVRIVCIDIAHGDSKHCVETVKTLCQQYSKLFIIAGNIATGDGARRLWEAGADAVKANVGGGSLCTTRIETGNGMPLLTSLMEIAQVKKELSQKSRPIYLISDGGCKNAGDLVKSLCFADMVMTGNLFAGCDETPGNRHYINGICYKEYVGSSTHKANHIEGVVASVPCTGSFQEILTKLLQAIQSGCSYQGCTNLTELKENPTFIRMTSAGLRESHPHDVVINRD